MYVNLLVVYLITETRLKKTVMFYIIMKKVNTKPIKSRQFWWQKIYKMHWNNATKIKEMWNEKHSNVFIFEQNLWKKKIFSQTLFQCIFLSWRKISQKTHNNSLHKLPKTKMGNSYGHRIVWQNILDDLTQWDHITPMTIPLHINCYPQRIAFGIKTTL